MEFEVDGVKVEVEIKSIDTNDMFKYHEVKSKIESNELTLVSKDKLDKFFSDFCELKQDSIESVKEEPEKETLIDSLVEKGPEVFEDVKEIFENNPDPEVKSGMKPWFHSKTIITNIVTAIGCIIATFASDDPNSYVYSLGSVIATVNLYLRSITKSEIKLPLENRIKGNKEV
jgi:hypothetical protein